MSEEIKLVTPEQLIEGWHEFRRNEIPNTIHHEYVVIGKDQDGNYIVRDPHK